MSLDIRKIVTVVDETLSEMGRSVSPPVRRAAVIAVITNPFAGRYVEDLTLLIEAGDELGKLLSSARLQRSESTGRRRKAMARQRWSARMARWSMQRRCCTRRWARRFVRPWARARR